ARVKNGAAAPIDGARVVAVERHDVARPAGRILGIEVRQRLPAAPQADHFDVVFARAVGDRLDDRIEPGDVAAAGANADSPFRPGGLSTAFWRIAALSVQPRPRIRSGPSTLQTSDEDA